MNVSVNGMRLEHLTVRGPDHSGARPQGRGSDDARVESGEFEQARSAWFDFNGDGKIEDSSPLYGGDGTLLGFEAQPPGRKVREVAEERHQTPAAVDHARDTYLRYSRTDTTETERAPAPEARVA